MRTAIIDDHPIFCDGVTAWLSVHAPDVEVVGSGPDAAAVCASADDLDLVLVDLDLGPGSRPPDELVDALATGGVKVLVVSALASPRIVRRCLAAGAAGYVSKSDTTASLLDGMRAVVAGEQFLTPDLAAILAESRNDVPDLSEKEVQTLRLYASGLALDSVARRMGVSPSTVREYISRVKRKYAEVDRQVRSRSDMLHAAGEDGFVPVVAYRLVSEPETLA